MTTTTSVPSAEGHIGDCVVCHYPNELHFTEGEPHSECTQCHDGLPQAGNVEPAACVVCHQEGDEGTCSIVNNENHEPLSCVGCHFNCGEGTTHMNICLECHSSEDILAQHEVELDVGLCSACHPQGNPGTCNLAHRHSTECIGCHSECADGPTTTTSVPPGHTGICLGCHSPDTLHFKEGDGHKDCHQCHQGGDVGASACSACHPVGNPGTCSLASYHGSTCLNCHVMCADSTTTSTPGEPTPTTVPPFAHREICLACHDTDDLHEGKGHSSLSCSMCHEDGRGQVGNVEPESCVACHPAGTPGKCNLASMHGPSTCLRCHQADCKEDKTTTTVEPTTTTTSPYFIHIETCMECHNSSDLHNRVEHNDCTYCHEGTPQTGNVDPSACIICHPGGDPGFCNLVTHHGGSCLECHAECEETTTTTTIHTPPVVIDITLSPQSAFRSHLIPLPLIMVIKGTESNFNYRTSVDFEGNDALTPPLSIILSPERIIVLSIIKPAGFKATGDSEVMVNVSSTVDMGGGESYEEVGGWSLTLKLLPLILDEK